MTRTTPPLYRKRLSDQILLSEIEAMQRAVAGKEVQITIKEIQRRKKTDKFHEKSKAELKRELKQLFSEFVRRHGECQIHHDAFIQGVILPFNCGGPLQCNHIFPVKYKNIEFNELNVFCGCAWGNKWEQENRERSKELFERIWGNRVRDLDRKKSTSGGPDKSRMKSMIFHYQKLLGKI